MRSFNRLFSSSSSSSSPSSSATAAALNITNSTSNHHHHPQGDTTNTTPNNAQHHDTSGAINSTRVQKIHVVPPTQHHQNDGERSSSSPLPNTMGDVARPISQSQAKQFFKYMKKLKIDAVEQLLKENIRYLMIRDDDISTPLIKAASRNMPEFVDLFCRMNRDNKVGFSCLDLTNKQRYTAINIAVKKQNTNIVKLLLQYGANISDTPNQDGNLPIHSASRRGFTEIISILVKHDPNQLNITNPCNRRTPLFMAAQHGHVETVAWLLDQPGIDLSIKSKDHKRPIHSAASHDNVEIVKLLLKKGKEYINVLTNSEKDKDKRYTPLHYCCKKAALTTAKYLLEQGAILDIFINNAKFNYFGKKTPLYLAIQSKREEILKLFLSYYKIIMELAENPIREDALLKCNRINIFDLDIQSIVKTYDYYVQQDDINVIIPDPSSDSGDSDVDDMENSNDASTENKVVKTVLRTTKEAISLAITEENQELIHLAFSLELFDCVKLYLASFPQLLNCKSTSNGNTLINKAAHIGNLEMMKYLVSKGSNISIPNDVGNLPIHRAAYCGHAELVKYLVEECGECVDVFQHSSPKSKRLENSLHLAARKGFLECVKVLLMNGSDITRTTKSESTTGRRDAIQLAKRYNQIEVYEFLKKVYEKTARSC
ncbi:hypothetical protein FDP41_004130 [Naegleria fowleri]|uniref:Uncharacterized protein n=1 Tax=Naegleria fowleri TaxID=5763 RepID=A0A6A5BU44_NAEFO|nr:uncharacterized protein FDP41_004130 [Naegleria fowleri]KAF0976835.1 hypothetical protein FDP41_004130 [Naegleria fowleri]CAG4710145.1 unnamed protein product [Naegleria fowleri]